MAAGGVAALVARQHPGHLGDPLVAVDDRRPSPSSTSPSTRLGRRRPGSSASAATWARWVTTSTWCVGAELGQRVDRRRSPRCRRCRRRPRRTPACRAPSSRSSLEHEPQGQHRARQLAARRHLGQRQQRRPGVGGQQELDVVAGMVVVVLADLDGDLGVRHRQLAQARRRRPRPVRRRRPAGRADRPRPPVARRPAAVAAFAVERGGPLVEALQLGEPVAPPRRGRPCTSARSSPYLRRRSRSSWRRSRTASSRSGSSSMPSPMPRSSATTSSSSASSDAQPVGDARANGARPAERRPARRPTRVAATAVVGQRVVRRCAGLAVADGVGERVLLGSSLRPRPASSSAGGVELVDLEPQQVDLPGPRPLVAAERGQLGVDLGQPGPRRPQRRQVDVAEAVERRALRRPRRAGSGGRAGRAGRRAGRRLGERGRPWPAGRRRRPATGRRRARRGVSTSSSSPIDEPAVDAGLGRAGAHDGGVGAAADEQLDRLDEHRLAGAGLAGDGGQPGPEDEVERARSRRGSRCAARSASAVREAELGLQDLVEVVRPNARSWPSRRPARTCTTSPSASVRDELAVDGEPGRAVAGDLDLDGLGRVEHERAVEQHVRRHRRQQQRPVARRDDRAAGRQRVGRRAGRRGDDQPVGGVAGERLAVDAAPAGARCGRTRASRRRPR